MRGKPFITAWARYKTRITPAHAGKTLHSLDTQTQPKDHPRACGENNAVSPNPLKNSGSPPRMRGKPRSIFGNRHADRITPAHAGKTFTQSCALFRAADHPRACGENTEIALILPFTIGSPPRMRGKQFRSFVKLCEFRITPAHAGKTKKKCAIQK